MLGVVGRGLQQGAPVLDCLHPACLDNMLDRLDAGRQSPLSARTPARCPCSRRRPWCRRCPWSWPGGICRRCPRPWPGSACCQCLRSWSAGSRCSPGATERSPGCRRRVVPGVATCTISSSPAPSPCTLSSSPAPSPCVFVSKLAMFRVPSTGSVGFTFSTSSFLAWRMLFCLVSASSLVHPVRCLSCWGRKGPGTSLSPSSSLGYGSCPRPLCTC